jgi:DNA topoisomerase-3
MDDLEVRIARLSDDEKRLFALISRSYLAAVMPDFEYRQTLVTMNVPLLQLGSGPAKFRAVGRVPLVRGWKAAFAAADREPGGEKEAEADAEQTLPPSSMARLRG